MYVATPVLVCTTLKTLDHCKLLGNKKGGIPAADTDIMSVSTIRPRCHDIIAIDLTIPHIAIASIPPSPPYIPLLCRLDDIRQFLRFPYYLFSHCALD